MFNQVLKFCPYVSTLRFASRRCASLQDLVHDAPPRLLDQLVRCGTGRHWQRDTLMYVDILGMLGMLVYLVLRMCCASCQCIDTMIIVRSLPVIFSEVNHEFLLRCRAWEPRWLLPGETIVADEAVTKSLKMECPVLLVRLP